MEQRFGYTATRLRENGHVCVAVDVVTIHVRSSQVRFLTVDFHPLWMGCRIDSRGRWPMTECRFTLPLSQYACAKVDLMARVLDQHAEREWLYARIEELERLVSQANSISEGRTQKREPGEGIRPT
ncbi:MAG: hypothetical protein PVSMB7_24270 [Chloroflexota bacterium]